MHGPSLSSDKLTRLLDAQLAIARHLADGHPGALDEVLGVVCRTLDCPGAVLRGGAAEAGGGERIASWPAVPAGEATGAALTVTLESEEARIGLLELGPPGSGPLDDDTRLWLDVVAAQLAQQLARVSVQRALQGRDRALTAAINGVVIADATMPGFPVVYANPGFERLTGWQAQEIIGRPCSVLQGPDTDPAAVSRMARALAEGREIEVTLRNQRKDGTPFWNEVFLSPVYDGERLVEYIGVQNDVSERRAAEEQAEFLAYHDSLTGLGNRALLARVLGRAASRVERHGVRAALAFLDLDAFKQLNDARGHAAGDQVLRVVADRLRAVVRPNDLLIRQGGDEFLLFMPDLEPRGATRQALAGAERMRLAVAEPIELDGELVTLRASVGVSLLGADAVDPDEAMRHADTAMYRAKRVARGGVRLYRDTGAPTPPVPPVASAAEGPDAATRAAALDEVLAREQLRAVYQPIVHLDTGDVVAYEALARGPVDSAVAQPDRLFTAARETGRLAEVDWACRAAAVRGALAAGLGRTCRLFINVEVEAVATPRPPALDDLLERSARELDVVVEITERALTAAPAELLEAVRGWRERGWGVALDDVGADVRALAVMPLVRPDVIKLDLRLLHENPTTEIAEIVQAVNAECERTGAVILAEGIETVEHVAMARAMGATLGQGWYFGRPGPLSPPATAPTRPIRVAVVPDRSRDVSPYEIVRRVRETRTGDKRLLFAISLQLEQQAAALGEAALILSAFQHARRFTPLTAKRYTLLATDAAFVAALGIDMPVEPACGVRGAALAPDDPLKGEWSVVVLGPHFAAALVAMDLGDGGADDDRGFDFAVTYDRELVIEAAGALVRRVRPLGA